MTLRRLDCGSIPGPETAELHFEGRPISFQPGESLAGALMAAGITDFRETQISGSRRGPWCLMGVCYECLLRVDGHDNQRACMTTARAGMVVERQIGARRDAVGGRE